MKISYNIVIYENNFKISSIDNLETLHEVITCYQQELAEQREKMIIIETLIDGKLHNYEVIFSH
jgi:hypothetical protein